MRMARTMFHIVMTRERIISCMKNEGEGYVL